MLLGIVKKNAIMQVDFAIEAERAGKAPAAAIYEGALVRFRPIMMTTVAAIMGTMPIVLGFGAGADVRRALGLAVVGGLLVSQLLTLYVTPVIYLYLDSLRMRLPALRLRRRPVTPPSPAPRPHRPGPPAEAAPRSHPVGADRR
jgi:Cu/Ag efflux pump CusA